MENIKEEQQQRKKLNWIFVDFFIAATKQFEGRMDEGKISFRELLDFISEWTDKNFHDD